MGTPAPSRIRTPAGDIPADQAAYNRQRPSAMPYSRYPAFAPIDLPDRARVRLAAANAIHAALDVSYVCYRAAGVDAIFPSGPFERRFRDIHTLSQQIQSRAQHFEAVGQILLGRPPEVFF